MSTRRPNESGNDYYARADREFEASPWTQAARLLAAVDAEKYRAPTPHPFPENRSL